MTVKAVLFDWDGTLYDILDFVVQTYGQVLREKGLREWTRQEYREKFRIDWRETLKEMGLSEHEGYLIEVWEQNMEHMRKDLKLHDDAKETISRLSKDYVLGVVSAAPRKALMKEVQRLGVKEHIRIIVSKNDTSETKPSPKPLLYASEKLGLRPEDCVYIGDMVEDIKAAKNAEMKSIAVSWGLHSKKRLLEETPDYLADSFRALEDYIKGIQ